MLRFVKPVKCVLSWTTGHIDLPKVTEIIRISMAAVLSGMLLNHFASMAPLSLQHKDIESDCSFLIHAFKTLPGCYYCL